MLGSCETVLEFCDPLISVDARNFSRRRTAVSSNDNDAKLAQKGSCGVTWPNFGILGPVISRERLKLQNSNLKRTWTPVSSKVKNAKLRQKGSCGAHLTQFWNFGIPPNISRTVETRYFIFGMDKNGGEFTWPKFAILRPQISRELFTLQTSNLKRRWTPVSSKEKCKIGSTGVMWGHVTQFFLILKPLISRERFKLKNSNLKGSPTPVRSKEKMQNCFKRGHVGGHINQFWIFGPPEYLANGWSK